MDTAERKVNLTNLIKAVDLYNTEKEADRKAYIANHRNNKNIRSNPVLEAIIEGLEVINPDYDPLDFIITGLSRLRIWGVIDNAGHYDIITEGLNAYKVSRESNTFILSCLKDFERRKDFIEKYITKEGHKKKESKISDYESKVAEDLKNYTTGEQSSILSRLRLMFDDEVRELEKIESYYDKNESQITVKSLFKDGEFKADPESLNEFFWANQSIDKSSSMIDHFRNLTRYSAALMHTGIIRDMIKQNPETPLSFPNQSDKVTNSEAYLLTLPQIDEIYKLCNVNKILDGIDVKDFIPLFDLNNAPQMLPKFKKTKQIWFCYVLSQTEITQTQVLNNFGIKEYRKNKSNALASKRITQVFRNEVARILDPTVKIR